MSLYSIVLALALSAGAIAYMIGGFTDARERIGAHPLAGYAAATAGETTDSLSGGGQRLALPLAARSSVAKSAGRG